MKEQVRLRKARRADMPAIEALIAESARALGAADYSAAQIDAALKTAWGVDSQLIDDQTYYVGEHGQRLVACGGWSHRHTLFGGDAQPDRIARELDPELESARIRAFFVHQAWSRQGLGRRLLARCENDAQRCGFRSGHREL
jgi:GNAT superfamily N-acetyltransferase